jgi:hypothetical protein
MTPSEKFTYLTEKIYQEVLDDIKLLLQQNLISKDEINNLNLQELMNEKGFEKVRDEFVDEMAELAFKFGTPSDELITDVERRIDYHIEYLGGKQQATGALLKRFVLDMINTGISTEETEIPDPGNPGKFIKQPSPFDQRRAEIQLTDAQLNVATNTAYYNIARDDVFDAFKDDPNQRFKYVGGVRENSSKQCRHLMEKQDPTGYTVAEITAGINTPFGIIDRYGRRPNFNCIHTWAPIGGTSNDRK